MDLYDYCPLCGDKWEDHRRFRCAIGLIAHQPFAFKKNIGYIFYSIYFIQTLEEFKKLAMRCKNGRSDKYE